MLGRKQARLLACAFLASAAITATTGIALADQTGETGSYTVAGIGYDNQSTLTKFPLVSAPIAASTAWTQDGLVVASGYMGVLPRLYVANGALCSQPSTYGYNGSAENRLVEATGNATSCNAGRAYYSYGVTQSWNPSAHDYQSFFTFRTPSQSF